MVQSRASLLEDALAKALGGSRQLVLEASSGEVAPAHVMTPPMPKPVKPPVIQQVATPTPAATLPAPPAVPETNETESTNPPAPAAPATLPPTPPTDPSQPSSAPAAQATAEPPKITSTTEPPSPQTNIDRQAKTFADFFNGQVLEIDIEEQP